MYFNGGLSVPARAHLLPFVAVFVIHFMLAKPLHAESLPSLTIAGGGEEHSHPFVFTTTDRLKRLVSDNRQIPIAAMAFLQAKIPTELKQKGSYIEPYSGCQINAYLKRFTYEQGSATKAAAEFAFYAYLHHLNKNYGTDPVAADSIQTSKAILLSWAKNGLRDNGQVFTGVTQFCDDSGKSTDAAQFDVGLTIGRGIPHWVAAQDLLIGLHALSPDEEATLNGFLAKLTELVIHAMNFRAAAGHLDCNRFSNQVSVEIAAIAGAARLLGNQTLLADVAMGGQHVAIPWTEQVTKTIYGKDDKPLGCYPANWDPAVFHQLATVQPGEIVDRYRAIGGQTFGYPMFSLTNLMLAASIFDSAGADAANWRFGDKSLHSSIGYYSYYFDHFMQSGAASVPNTVGDTYPGFEQYAGKLLSRENGSTVEGIDGLIIPFILGTRLYPNDVSIRQVVQRAHMFGGYSVGRRVDSMFMDCLPDVADLVGAR
jgi:hypothetical protein